MDKYDNEKSSFFDKNGFNWACISHIKTNHPSIHSAILFPFLYSLFDYVVSQLSVSVSHSVSLGGYIMKNPGNCHLRIINVNQPIFLASYSWFDSY